MQRTNMLIGWREIIYGFSLSVWIHFVDRLISRNMPLQHDLSHITTHKTKAYKITLPELEEYLQKKKGEENIPQGISLFFCYQLSFP